MPPRKGWKQKKAAAEAAAEVAQETAQQPENHGPAHGAVGAEGVREALKARPRDDQGRVVLEELVETSVVAMFFLQKLGKATSTQIGEKINEIGAWVDEHLLLQAIEALQARGLISYATGRLKKGEFSRMWKLRSVVWSRPPEVAHITDLLPTLVATEEAQKIITEFNTGEREGDGVEKAKRKLGYADYVDLRVDFLTLDEMIGSQPLSPYLEKTYKKSPHNGVTEADLRFNRTPDGALQINSDAVSGWVRTGLRAHNFSEAAASYIGCSAAKIVPNCDLVQIVLPVIDSRTGAGAGLNKYECLPPGQKFSLHFRLPTRGVLKPMDFVRFLAKYGPRPMRGLSPARGNRFGKVAVVGHEVIGDFKDDRAILTSVMAGLPEEAREHYEKLLAEIG